MNPGDVFEYCGYVYSIEIEDGKVKRIDPAGGVVQATLDQGEIEGLEPNLSSMTKFEKQVLKKAMEIPCGRVVTYGELARAVGNPKAVRAVGNVMAQNPIPIIVPCHRVVKSDRTIGGYAHGSETKESILKSEGITFEGKRISRECLHRF